MQDRQREATGGDRMDALSGLRRKDMHNSVTECLPSTTVVAQNAAILVNNTL